MALKRDEPATGISPVVATGKARKAALLQASSGDVNLLSMAASRTSVPFDMAVAEKGSPFYQNRQSISGSNHGLPKV